MIEILGWHAFTLYGEMKPEGCGVQININEQNIVRSPLLQQLL
jgi:hypothetical protein